MFSLLLLFLLQANTGGYDFSTIALKISPKFDCEGRLDATWVPPTVAHPSLNSTSCDSVSAAAAREAAFPGANFPGAMLQHHSFRELQVIDLDIVLLRERQLIQISNATSGKFRLVVQGRAITSELSMDSSANDIKNALYNAALSIVWSDRETYSFTVWVNRGAKFLDITVQFETDRTSPFTLLRVYPVSLVGEQSTQWLDVNVFRANDDVVM
jgi:hypothetical protein